ncbi:MAG: tetraspanin family protein [Deltaproteobacteria bacterium]|nr:tetraspanin family protein [Deltaproteobacteria bacterium]
MISFVLLWLLFFAAASCFTAFLSTFRKGGGKWGKVLFILCGALIIISATSFSVVTYFLYVKGFKPDWLFVYAFSWFIAYTSLFGFFTLKNVYPLAYRLKTCLAAIVFLMAGLFLFAHMDRKAIAYLKDVQKDAQALIESVNSPPVADEKNALTYYEEAFNLLDKHDKLPRWVTTFRRKNDDGFSIPKAKVVLEERKEVMALLKKAALTESFHQPLEASYKYEIPLFAPYRNSAYLLALQAHLYAIEGNIQSSLETIEHIWKIADHLNDYPVLISNLLSIAVAGIGYDALEKALYDVREFKGNDMDLPASKALEFLKSYPEVMKGESAFGMGGWAEELSSDNIFYTMEEWIDIGFPPIHRDIPGNVLYAVVDFNNAVISSLYRVFFASEDVAVGERYWKGFFQHLEKPFHNGFRPFKKWEKEIKNDKGGPLTGVEFFFRSDDMMSHYYARNAEGEARQRLAAFALAVEGFRAEKGKYPSSITELKPRFLAEIAIDPFDGKPLKIKAVDGGLILYSIGRDMVDDGGAELVSDEKKGFLFVKKKGDITFLLGKIFKERRLKTESDSSL